MIEEILGSRPRFASIEAVVERAFAQVSDGRLSDYRALSVPPQAGAIGPAFAPRASRGGRI
jgi:hypothetical protein